MSTGPTPHRAEEAPACLDLRALLVPRHQIHADLTAIPPRLAGVLPAHRLSASVPSPSRALVCFSMGLENAVVSCMAPVLFQAVLPAFDFSYRVKQCLIKKCHSWLILLLARVESIRAEKGTDKGRHSRVPQKQFSGVFPTAT